MTKRRGFSLSGVTNPELTLQRYSVCVEIKQSIAMVALKKWKLGAQWKTPDHWSESLSGCANAVQQHIEWHFQVEIQRYKDKYRIQIQRQIQNTDSKTNTEYRYKDKYRKQIPRQILRQGVPWLTSSPGSGTCSPGECHRVNFPSHTCMCTNICTNTNIYTYMQMCKYLHICKYLVSATVSTFPPT